MGRGLRTPSLSAPHRTPSLSAPHRTPSHPITPHHSLHPIAPHHIPSHPITLCTPSHPIALCTPSLSLNSLHPIAPHRSLHPIAPHHSLHPIAPITLCTPSHPITLCTPSHPIALCTPSHPIAPITLCTPSHPIALCTPSHPITLCTPSHPITLCTPSFYAPHRTPSFSAPHRSLHPITLCTPSLSAPQLMRSGGECANFVRLIEPWNRTHLYTCGTGAYRPICTFINRGWKAEDYLFRLVPGYQDSGKGKCSYDPHQEDIATIINGNLYAGVYVDFMGTDPAVFRTMGGQPAVRTEQYDSRWLNGDVFILPTQDERNPIVYAVFSTAGSVFKGSAVCVYSMADIRNVFNGPFSHKHGHNYQWTAYTGKIPYPRPGTCPGGTFTPDLRSTKQFSDEAVKLLVRTGVDYRFTTVAVDLVDAVDGRYEVLFLGTDRGTVQKVIVLPKDPSTLEEVILEEVEVFRQQLYVSSEAGLTQVTLHRCAVYGKACSDCCLARDPYCAWDGESCAPFTAATKRYPKNTPFTSATNRYPKTAPFTSATKSYPKTAPFTSVTKRRSRRQDIKHGDPLRQCRGFNAKVENGLRETVQFGVEGSSTFLECQPRSPQANVKWLLQKDGRRKA
ncbi:hypothetical protein JZ751_028638, partial [Albula glossodonta]